MFPTTFTTSDNLELKCSATVAMDNPRAILIVVHGLGDHSQSLPYRHLETSFADKNFALIRYDLRGHGESGGARQHVNSLSDLRDDLGLLVKLTRRNWPGLPVYLLGVSLGGLIVLDFALNATEDCDGVITLAPALSVEGVSRPVRTIVPIIAGIFPKLSFDPGLDLKNISRDQEAARSYTADPLFSTRLTIRLASETIKTVSSTQQNAEKLNTPILILHGDSDAIVPTTSSEMFFERVSSPIKHRIVYPGAMHNLLLETNREQVYSDIHNWLNDRLS